MSQIPEIITPEQVAEQTHAMMQQKDQLESQIRDLSHRLKQIESSLAEAEGLKHKIQEQIKISVDHVNTEWKRKSEYYPEIRLKILEKTLELVAPPPAAKKP